MDCKHICNWQENPYQSYGYCEDGFDFYELELDDDWGQWAACATLCIPEGEDWYYERFDFDFSLIEDIMGEEISQEDKDSLNDLANTVSDLTSFASRATWGAVAAVATLLIAQ